MKNILFDLTLFGEGEGGGGDCAAEQSATEATAEPSMHGNEEGASEKAGAFVEGAQTTDGEADGTALIAGLLGLEAKDTETLIAAIRARRARVSLSERLRQRSAEKTYARLLSEADRLSSKIEGFDLKGELSDRRFFSMIKAGLSMEEAFRAVHFDELVSEQVEAAKKQAVSKALEKMRGISSRPDENGAGGRAPAKSQTGVESLTGRGIRDILRRVENGAKIKF